MIKRDRQRIGFCIDSITQGFLALLIDFDGFVSCSQLGIDDQQPLVGVFQQGIGLDGFKLVNFVSELAPVEDADINIGVKDDFFLHLHISSRSKVPASFNVTSEDLIQLLLQKHNLQISQTKTRPPSAEFVWNENLIV